MSAKEVINDFLEQDTQKLAEIIEQHPQQIPVSVIADWFGCSKDVVRESVKQQGLLGLAERKPGRMNYGYVIPTGHFVRWYTCRYGIN